MKQGIIPELYLIDYLDPGQTVKQVSILKLYLYCHYQGLAIKQGIIPELSEEDLEVTKVIGRGAYGDVQEGVLRVRETGAQHCVAIKSLKSKLTVNKSTRSLIFCFTLW